MTSTVETRAAGHTRRCHTIIFLIINRVAISWDVTLCMFLNVFFYKSEKTCFFMFFYSKINVFIIYVFYITVTRVISMAQDKF